MVLSWSPVRSLSLQTAFVFYQCTLSLVEVLRLSGPKIYQSPELNQRVVQVNMPSANQFAFTHAASVFRLRPSPSKNDYLEDDWE